MTLRYSTDIVIFGGGIAGLWLLNSLREAGYQAILFERHTIGGGQTLASQGIIHGGLKYALQGSLTGAAQAIAAMPERWRQCLAGEGDMDLRGTQVLCEHYYMWSGASMRSKLKSFLGSKSLRGRVDTIPQAEYPEFFQQASVKGTLYQLPDFVVDSESLIDVLADRQQAHLFSLPDQVVEFGSDGFSDARTMKLTHREHDIEISAQRFIFAAGEGNKGLINAAGLGKPQTQVRPLNMVYLKMPGLPQLFVHCIGDSFSLTPRLTVTSHQDESGETVWYLGGDIAETGVGKTDAGQIDRARQLLCELFPWIDVTAAEWRCFTINRAEPKVENESRPDDAYFTKEENILVTWPTKLTLAPALSDQILADLRKDKIIPSIAAPEITLEAILKPAVIGAPEWHLGTTA